MVDDNKNVENAILIEEFPTSHNTYNKFQLLMWKNWMHRYRNKVQTAIQIVLPVTFSLILVLIRSLVEPIDNPENTTYNSLPLATLQTLRTAPHDIRVKEWKLVYTPVNAGFHELMTNVTESLDLDGFEGVNTVEELEKVMIERELLCGIVFHNPENLTRLTPYLTFALRFPSETRFVQDNNPVNFSWHTNLLYPQYSGGEPNQIPFYYEDVFLAIQDRLSYHFIQILCVHSECEYDDLIPDIQIQRFPYPPYRFDMLLQALEIVFGLFIVLSLVYTMSLTVHFIAVEKEKQLKDVMEIMGMPVWLHSTCWFCNSMIFLLVSITVMIAIMKIPIFSSGVSVLTNSNAFVVWMFLFFYIITVAIYSFFMSTLFASASTATSMAGLIWFISYAPFIFLAMNYVQIPYIVALIMCFMPNAAMAYGCRIIIELEGMGNGLHLYNLFDDTISESGLSVGVTICMMLVTSIIFIFITFYYEHVFPESIYRLPKKWNFLFKKEFWARKKNTDEVTSENNENVQLSTRYFERNHYDSVPGVEMINLRKEYNSNEVACKDITLDMYRDQITVLIGHNGAGKSTAIKMLTGMITPTSGTAIINGYDIRTARTKARQSIGICPQHNILFDELTVREHLQFYCRLKGLRSSDTKKEVNKFVELLKLEAIIDTRSKALSGGQQRKLQCAIALCGGSKVILCDEPTAAMDPIGKREVWDVFGNEKFGRTIILTTHEMDEADVLGDRIAIMANGEMKCCGTSFFLKKRFGSGYRLTCVKQDGCDSSNITKIIQKHIPEIEIHEELAGEVSYILLYEFMEHFEKIFDRLEKNLKSLKIHSFGVSTAEIEEVFLTLGKEKSKEPTTSSDDIVGKTYDEVDLIFGRLLYLNQSYAMLKKRLYWLLSHWILFLVLNLIMISSIVISFILYQKSSSSFTLPFLNITLKPYGATVTMLQWDDSLNESNETSGITQIIINQYIVNTDEKAGEMVEQFTEDMNEHLFGLGNTLRIRTNTRYLMGLASDGESLTAFYNGQLFHTAPLALNRLYTAVMQAKLGECIPGIYVANWPIEFRNESKVILTKMGSSLGSQLAINTSLAMAFMMAFFTMFYIEERISKAKLLQFLAGVNTLIFWGISILFDFAIHIVTSLIFYSTVAMFNEKYWSTAEELTPLFSVLVFFGLSSLAIAIVSSFLFTDPSYGFVGFASLFVITGMCFYQLFRVMSSHILGLSEIATTLEWLFLFSPPYAMCYSLFNLHQYKILSEFSPTVTVQSWDKPGIGRATTYMIFVSIVCFSILFAFEFRFVPLALHYIRGLHKAALPTIPTIGRVNVDVQKEKDNVNEMSPDELDEYNLVIRNLTKFYGNVAAVKELCLAIERGECFGLLGMNGAGKTSTFKMLTGDTPISSGDVFVKGMSLKTHWLDVLKSTGYCPQFNALFETLKGTQTLEIFALLRGCRPSDISRLIDHLSDDLNVKNHIKKRIRFYSGGMRRKLHTAIALIGNPYVVYLDEPSSGLDPAAKRNVWSVVTKARRSGTSIILTSHSMEECEAICTRLAIMVSGELKCIGSAQYLKSKFRKGFLISIKTPPLQRMTRLAPETIMIQIAYFMKRNFKEAILQRENLGLLIYFVPKTKKTTASSMFGIMEKARETLDIADYSINQTTIEQVFLSFGGVEITG